MEDKKQAVYDLTTSRLLFLIKEDEVPARLSYIVDEVAIKRFNRLANEGYKSYTQDGLRIEFDDDDFKPFLADIDDWLEEKDKNTTDGYRVRFL